MNTCQRNLTDPYEDCGSHVTYVPCGKPAVAEISQRHYPEWYACEEHALEARHEGCTLDGCYRTGQPDD